MKKVRSSQTNKMLSTDADSPQGTIWHMICRISHVDVTQACFFCLHRGLQSQVSLPAYTNCVASYQGPKNPKQNFPTAWRWFARGNMFSEYRPFRRKFWVSSPVISSSRRHCATGALRNYCLRSKSVKIFSRFSFSPTNFLRSN